MATGGFIAQHAALLRDPRAFRRHMQKALQTDMDAPPVWDGVSPEDDGLSVVLFLLGAQRSHAGQPPEPCLIFNKRSAKVRQPGDICCPGGGVMPRLDRLAAHLLRLPWSPLRRWTYYPSWRNRAPRQMAGLALLLATALREGLEEMRLNPFGVSFQGLLPAERLVLFRRTIVPLVAWVRRQQRFHPNWEVEKIIRIPLRDFLQADHYIALRLRMMSPASEGRSPEWKTFPAFRHRSPEGSEVLWGATYRITMNFLERVFGFQPPDPTGAAMVEKRLTSAYLTGNGQGT
jgi:hypothetical protein